MEIFDILKNRQLGSIIIFVVAGVLYFTGRLKYYALFPSKRGLSRGKSFTEEVRENENKPISNSESIGSISMRLGEDIRDVWEMGYSNDQINDVLTGKYSLD